MNTATAFGVRRATTVDAASLARLRYEFRASRAQTVEQEAPFLHRAEAWMTQHLPMITRWRAWVVEKDSAIVGNIWLQIIEKLPNPAAETECHGYVTNFFVRPECRGAGAGSALLRVLNQECEGLNVDTIFLWPSAESRPLYERFGFAPSDDVLTLKR